jgi:flavin reductase (DIM6/NTAB) family NADH-FMN oxidoreductase RutF
MDKTPAFGECRLLTIVEQGEYSNFIGEVEYSGVSQEPEGHADEVTLFLKDLSENKLRPL